VKRRSIYNDYRPEVPTSAILKEGDPWPWGRGTAARDIELVYSGMPTGATLFAWLPEKRQDWLDLAAGVDRARRLGLPRRLRPQRRRRRRVAPRDDSAPMLAQVGAVRVPPGQLDWACRFRPAQMPSESRSGVGWYGAGATLRRS
jgi:hypothetical protein